MADGEHYTTLESNDIVRYSYASAAPGESMLPAPAPNLVITDYAFSPDERSILIASGRKPIYRHSYTTSYSLVRDNAARRLLLARRAEDRLLGPQRSLRLRHRLPDHAPHHRRRGVERGDQRHDRLGLRGGVRRNAGLRLLARQPPHRLPAFRRERSAADGDDALRRQTLQQGLFIQIPQGRGAQLRGPALDRRPRDRRQGAHRHGRGDRPVHSPHRLDARRTAVVLPPQPPPEHLRDDRLRTPRSAAHGLRGAGAAICRARGRRDRDLRRPRPFPRAAGEPHGLHAPLPVQPPPGHPRTGDQRPVGGDPGCGNRRQARVVPLDRDLAAAPQPVQRAPRRQGQTASHHGRGLLHRSPERRDEILHHHLFQRLDPQRHGGLRRRRETRPSAATRSTPIWSSPAASIPRSVTPYC